MTEVAFHFNAPDKLAYACRFARKASRRGARVAVSGAWDDLQRLDAMLWAMEPVDFVAHCLDDAAPEVLQLSPVVLLRQPGACPHREILLNVADTVPSGFAQFARVVEVVAAHDETDRALARQRWRHYQAEGHAIVRHDLVLQGAA